jgi:hypothetical protein
LPTTFAVPTVEPVRVTLQLPLPFKLQFVVVGVTVLPELKATVPVGTVDPDDAVLTTVAVQVDPWFTIMGVEQLIVVEVP